MCFIVLDRKAMSDVTSYRNPPPSVHAVLQATLLLFGEDEDLTGVGGGTLAARTCLNGQFLLNTCTCSASAAVTS